MKRTVSVVASASGAAADVRLYANRTLGEVLPQLMRLTGSAGPLLRAGGAALVHDGAHAAAATAVTPDGTPIVNRPPRLATGGAPPVVVFPSPPTPATTGRLPLLASLAPLLAGVVLAMVMHRWEFLAFAVMSPLVVLGQALTARWGARRANRAAAREYVAATALAEQQLAEAVAAEAQRRHDRAPDLGLLVRSATD